MHASLYRAVEAVFRKEARISLRSRSSWLVVLMFALTTLSCVSLLMQGDVLSPRLAAAMLWVILFFSLLSGAGRGFADEEQAGTLMALSVYGSSQAVLFGKGLFMAVLLFALSLLIVPVYLVLMDVAVFAWGLLLLTLLSGTYGMAMAGTLLSALMAGARAQNGLLSILMLPVLLPILLPAIVLTAAELARLGQIPFQHLHNDGGLLRHAGGVRLRRQRAVGGESAVADLEIHRRAAAHDLGRFVGADEPAGAFRAVGVYVERDGNARAQRAEHIERKIAHGVDAVRAAPLKQAERRAVAVAAVGARLEHRVRGQLAGAPRLIEHPEQTLIVYEQPPDAEIAHALCVLERADELFLAAQPVADDGALPRKARGGGVIRGPRADRHGERNAAVTA